MSECSHNCSSCKSRCASYEAPTVTADTNIKKIVAVLSGKGGVGKSMVSGLLAVELARKGYKVGIMDADITGPSIARMFGAGSDLQGDENGIFPYETNLGIRAVSINMILDSEDDPVLWRGPVIAGVIRQFYTEVHWGELDYLVVDMPPGTGDVALSVFKDMPVDSVVMVTTPGSLVSMIVGKAINMVNMSNVKIAGLVENMAYLKCDSCGNEISLYKNDNTYAVAERYGLEILAKLPMDPEMAEKADEGFIEEYDGELLKNVVEKIEDGE